MTITERRERTLTTEYTVQVWLDDDWYVAAQPETRDTARRIAARIEYPTRIVCVRTATEREVIE